MKADRYIAMRMALALAFSGALTTGCASQITTANSVITTVCDATPPEMFGVLREVVGGMKNYRFTEKSPTEALVKYNPSNPLMGSATVAVRASPATGITKDGLRVTGVELTYTDVTPLMSQDTAFGGGDLIGQLKSAVAEYAEFQGQSCTTVKRY